MKIVLPLLFVAVIAMTGCTTLANRRDLYSPGKAQGPNTTKYNDVVYGTIYTDASHPERVKNH